MGRVLGIDLGTTNSAMAIIENGRPRILANAEGERTTPSVVSFLDEDSYLVGSAAKARAAEHPELTVSSIKRLIGLPFERREHERAALPYRTAHAADGGICVKIKTRELTDAEIQERVHERVARQGARIGLYAPKVDLRIDGIDGHEYSPEQISSFILGKLRADAEAALGEPVEQAVITVPAYFDDAQRQATRRAGQLAGLEVLRIVSEPTAAALAYGAGSPELDERVLIFDLGGGTFDVSLLSIEHGVFNVLATAGDNHLGGDDWDQRLAGFLASEFREKTGVDPTADPLDRQRLRETADAAKIALSDATETLVSLRAGGAKLDVPLTRARFEGMTAPLRTRVERVMHEIMRAVEDRGAKLDKVLLVGGSTRMPAIRELVESCTGMEPEVSVNPDEAVALGAAVQGGLLTGEVSGISLHDVTPLSLGVETRGGLMATVIPRHTQIPVQRTRTFMTTEDGQTAVTVKVVQGERAIADDNELLGAFRLEGIEPLPAGRAKIDVVFDIDANNIVTVVARDQLTGAEGHVHIAGPQLDEADVARILAESERHREEDEALREEASAEEEARALVRTTRRAQSAYVSMLSQGDNDAIRLRANALADLVDGHDAAPAEIEAAMERLRAAREPLERVAAEARTAKAHGAGWTVEENAAPAIRAAWEKNRSDARS